MLNNYSQIAHQSKVEKPIFVQLESRRLLLSFIRRPFSGQSIFSSL